MDVEKIKSIVSKNFDESVPTYDAFEEKYNLFRTLARELADFCGIDNTMNVLDVGCGSGASILLLCTRARSVVGIDLSAGMIEAARRNVANVEFLVGDAEKLTEYFGKVFDAVVYNATIFLVPSPKKTLAEARSVLTNGVCGASYLVSLFSDDGDILAEARRGGLAQDGTFVKEEDIRTAFADVFGTPREKTLHIPMDASQAEAFFGIQAQSASLFPGKPYEERRALVASLFSHIRENYGGLEMRWGLISSAHCQVYS